MRKAGPVTVAIVGPRYPLGVVLKVLLRAAGFEARFLGASDPERLGEALRGFWLVVLCSDSGIGEEVGNGLLTAGAPVLELVRDGGEDGPPRENSVLWLCGVDVLEERIRSALRPAAGNRA